MSEDLDRPECQALLRARRVVVQAERERRRRDYFQQSGVPSVREFYAGRHVFITGASGFVGRVIVEKLLRSCPDIAKIYVLLRPRRGVDSHDRLQTVLDVPMFDRLRQENPQALQKIVPIRGDCSELGLGINEQERQVLVDKVSIIIHSAASVRFTDAVKKAVLLNTRGTREIVAIAKEMKNLKALVHVSTAYCFTNHNPTDECVYPTDHDWKDVIKAAELPDADVLDNLGSKYLGFQPNTYVFTKALSERVIEDASKELPVVIIRPTIITGAINEPLPGWIDNFNGFGGLWAIACKGVLRVSNVPHPLMRLDLIPVDVVSNATILAGWLIGTGAHEGNPPLVINTAVADVKPSSYHMMRTVFESHRDNQRIVYPGAVRYPYYWNIENSFLSVVLGMIYHVLFGLIVDGALKLMNKKPMLMPLYRRYTYATTALAYFGLTDFTFITTNFWRLNGFMHPEDIKTFNIDEADADWMKISENNLRGIMLYALKEKNSDKEKDLAHIRRLWWAEVILHVALAAFAIWLLRVWWS